MTSSSPPGGATGSFCTCDSRTHFEPAIASLGRGHSVQCVYDVACYGSQTPGFTPPSHQRVDLRMAVKRTENLLMRKPVKRPITNRGVTRRDPNHCGLQTRLFRFQYPHAAPFAHAKMHESRPPAPHLAQIGFSVVATPTRLRPHYRSLLWKRPQSDH